MVNTNTFPDNQGCLSHQKVMVSFLFSEAMIETKLMATVAHPLVRWNWATPVLAAILHMRTCATDNSLSLRRILARRPSIWKATCWSSNQHQRDLSIVESMRCATWRWFQSFFSPACAFITQLIATESFPPAKASSPCWTRYIQMFPPQQLKSWRSSRMTTAWRWTCPRPSPFLAVPGGGSMWTPMATGTCLEIGW